MFETVFETRPKASPVLRLFTDLSAVVLHTGTEHSHAPNVSDER
jgi:hypothetical protein